MVAWGSEKEKSNLLRPGIGSPRMSLVLPSADQSMSQGQLILQGRGYILPLLMGRVACAYRVIGNQPPSHPLPLLSCFSFFLSLLDTILFLSFKKYKHYEGKCHLCLTTASVPRTDHSTESVFQWVNDWILGTNFRFPEDYGEQREGERHTM